ncbi:type I restriction endonuclease subunit R [Rickettsia bellii]
MEPTEQDKILYALCRPERLLDLIANFCVFDNAVRKIARHHQFFATHAAAKRIQQHDEYHIRKGGVIWHTQGTGKSLTMILIAKFLLKSNDTENLRIIIITDRTELDEQIKNAFKNCGFEPKNAISSEHLIKLIKCNASVITSLIHKFNTAFKKEFQDLNNNILVFVDECHRTQHGDLANKMRAILPNACYIGFTGTPLFKEYKNTMEKFGGSIHNYTLKDALKDNIIVKLFYEGRIIQQHLNDEISINKNFDTITNDLDEKQKTSLKRRFSHPTTLSNTEKTIYAKAADISTHYSKTFKGTGLKGMLIAPSRAIAIRFKKILDQIGQVNSEVVISSFDERKGNTDIRSKNEIQEFLTTQKGLKSNHHKITKEFNSDDGPEILIVVSKLLTGFDAPRNTVFYICKKLKEHTLLQAISRINRLFEKNEKTKEYGYIIDYEGLRVALNNAYKTYENHNIQNFNIRNLEKLNKEDLEDTIFFVDDKIQELFPSLQEIKDIFTNVPNSLDPEQIEQHLADENIRSNFYFLLDKFKNLMSIASNSNKLCQVFSIEQLAELQNGLKNFDKLKKIVEKRYNEKTDKKIYTDQIAKLLDEHIIAGDIIKTDMVNIFDNQILEHFITRVDITDVDKANQINAQLQDVINDYISADPALSRKFSELINSTITQHHYKRLSDSDFLNKSINIINEFKKDVPTELNNNKTIIAFYRKLLNFLQNQTGQDQRENTIKIALDMYEIIKNKKVIHWTINSKVINEMKKSLNNYFFDVVKNEMRIDFNTKNLSNLTDSLIDLAIEHES